MEQKKRAVICDDDTAFTEELADRLKGYFAHLHISTCPDGWDLWDLFQNGKQDVDIVFLDIEMPGLGGLETARRIRKINKDVTIIIVTSHHEHVFSGYDIQAFHFLLKPLDYGKLYQVALDAWKHTSRNRQEHLLIQTRHSAFYVPLGEILYLESQRRTVTAYTRQDSFRYYQRLDVLEETLKGKGFFRCHNSYLVNTMLIEHVNKADKTAIISSGKQIPISRQKVIPLLTYLKAQDATYG